MPLPLQPKVLPLPTKKKKVSISAETEALAVKDAVHGEESIRLADIHIKLWGEESLFFLWKRYCMREQWEKEEGEEKGDTSKDS